MSVFTLKDGIVISQEVINHNDPPVENIEVLQVLSDKDESGGQFGYIWTFVYPGCCIYQWQTKGQRKVRNRLDCSKLVPSSESLKTIAIDEHFSPGRCQVASMCIQAGKLYVGTSWGCLIVADANSMRPISVFRLEMSKHWPVCCGISRLFSSIADPTLKKSKPLYLSMSL